MGFLRIVTTLVLAVSFALASAVLAKDELPILRDGLSSETYEVQFLDNPYAADITFHPQKQFFIYQYGDYIKIDARGRKVFQLEYSEGLYRPAFTPYVITKRGLYDFSQARPKPRQIVKFYNDKKDRRLTRDSFIKVFGKSYAQADVVVYGNYDSDVGRYPAYMKIGGDWSIFYVSPGNIEVESDYDLGITIEGFPPKFERMILLRDPVQKRYSHNSSRVRDREVSLPEDRLQYPRNRKLTKLSYKSQYVSEHYAYTSIPAIRGGYAIHQLNIDGEKIDFKEIAVRSAFSLKVDTNLNLFVLPKPYASKVPVSFLEFRPGNNIDTSGSDGVYIIRPKR